MYFNPQLNTIIQFLSCIVNRAEVDWSICRSFSKEDWVGLYELAQQHGVVAVVFEKIKTIPKEFAPPRDIVLRWLSHAVSLEKQMIEKEAIAAEFADKLAVRNIPTIVLKGLAFATYYPNTHHREYGDLDCFLNGKKEEGDKAVVEFGGTMEEAGYKHSHLHYKGLMIENHRYLTSFDNSKGGIKTEQLLQEMIATDLKPIGQTKLLTPNAEFNALFMVKHAQRHFIKEGIRLRHLLDWALFLNAEAKNIDWGMVIPAMRECRRLDFARVMTAICKDKLGLSLDIEELNGRCNVSDAVLADIMGNQPDPYHENILQKAGRILRRLHRMWKFRTLADENYLRLVWNNIAFSGCLQRKARL